MGGREPPPRAPWAFLVVLTLIVGCGEQRIAPVSRDREERSTVQEKSPSTEAIRTTMVTSYYGRNDGFDGRRTASGERFDASLLTAAHRTLPFGTRLHLTNPETGSNLTVTVNDRGPHVAGRDLDISYGAAQRLGIVKAGVAPLRVEIIPRERNRDGEKTKEKRGGKGERG